MRGLSQYETVGWISKSQDSLEDGQVCKAGDGAIRDTTLTHMLIERLSDKVDFMS